MDQALHQVTWGPSSGSAGPTERRAPQAHPAGSAAPRHVALARSARAVGGGRTRQAAEESKWGRFANTRDI